MYFSGTPTPSLNQKDLINQEKTRNGFLLTEIDGHAAEDPQLSAVNKVNNDDEAIIKEPSK